MSAVSVMFGHLCVFAQSGSTQLQNHQKRCLNVASNFHYQRYGQCHEGLRSYIRYKPTGAMYFRRTWAGRQKKYIVGRKHDESVFIMHTLVQSAVAAMFWISACSGLRVCYNAIMWTVKAQHCIRPVETLCMLRFLCTMHQDAPIWLPSPEII